MSKSGEENPRTGIRRLQPAVVGRGVRRLLPAAKVIGFGVAVIVMTTTATHLGLFALAAIGLGNWIGDMERSRKEEHHTTPVWSALAGTVSVVVLAWYVFTLIP